MVLMSQIFRSAAITGNTDAGWFKAIAGRQGGRWAEQHVQAALSRPAPDAAERLRALTELHDQGIVTDAEFEALRSKLSL